MGGSMTKILPGLYVGGFDNAKNEEELMANCISHIIIVQNSKNDIERVSIFEMVLIVSCWLIQHRGVFGILSLNVDIKTSSIRSEFVLIVSHLLDVSKKRWMYTHFESETASMSSILNRFTFM